MQLARFATAALAVYIVVATFVLIAPQGLLGVDAIDARWLGGLVGVLGLAYAAWPRPESTAATLPVRALRKAWAVGMTCATLGRALWLLTEGDRSLARSRELLGVYSWALLWLAGVLALVILTGASALGQVRDL